MNSKTTIVLSALSIVALALMFASGAVVGNHQALAFGWYGGPWGGGWGGYYGGWGGYYGGWGGYYGGWGGYYGG